MVPNPTLIESSTSPPSVLKNLVVWCLKKMMAPKGGRDVTCDVDDEIPQDTIRRMSVGFIRPIEGHLVADREEPCSTQVEPLSTQAQQASPKEATNAPTEE
jgi:hypothetical protein